MGFFSLKNFFLERVRILIFLSRKIFFRNLTLGYMTKTPNQVIFFLSKRKALEGRNTVIHWYYKENLFLMLLSTTFQLYIATVCLMPLLMFYTIIIAIFFIVLDTAICRRIYLYTFSFIPPTNILCDHYPFITHSIWINVREYRKANTI
jgi:hypothetical protein